MSQSLRLKTLGQYAKLWSKINIAVPVKTIYTKFMCVVSVSVGIFFIFRNAIDPIPMKRGVNNRANSAK